MKLWVIDECDISNAKFGIYLRGTNNAHIVRNNIFGLNTRASRLGVTMEGMAGYNFTENKIRRTEYALMGKTVGQQNGANIYHNEMSENYIESAYLVNNNTKLLLGCNEFLNNEGVDIKIADNALPTQGDLFYAAGNTFSVNTAHPAVGVTTTGVFFLTIPGGAMTYYHADLVAEKPLIVSSGINLFEVLVPNNLNKCLEKNIIYFDAESNTTCSAYVALYESILNTGVLPNLNCIEFPYLCSLNLGEIEETALDELIPYYLSEEHTEKRPQDVIHSLTKFLALPNNGNNVHRKLQLSSYYTLNKEFLNAENINNLILNSNENQEWKDLASIYAIHNELAKVDATWSDMTSNDISIIKGIAMQETYSMANIRAKNILELVEGIRFEEEVPEHKVNIDPNIPETIDPTFTIYPNPINGILNIGYNMPINTAFKVSIYNLISNREVYKGTMSAQPFVLDVSQWQSGYYSVVISDINGEILFKSKTKIKN